MTNSTTSGGSVQTARLARLLQLLAQDPRNAPLRRDCVDLAMATRDFDAVLQAADATLRVTPDDASARFDRATGLLGKQQYREALEILRSLATFEAEAFGIRFNMALCHYCMGEFATAVPLLADCYERGLRDAGLLRLLVTSYHHVGRIEDAARIATENPAPASTDAALAGAYALVYLDSDDAMRAASWAKTALQLDPRSIDGRVTKATLLIARMDMQPATEILQGVLEDAPQTARAWIGLGSLALLRQDLARARSLLERAVELMPVHVGSWHMLGWTQLMQQDVPAAEACFERALGLDRNFAETHGALASIAALKGDRERAERLIDIALRLDPNCLSATFARAVLTRAAGDPAKATLMINEAAAALGIKQQSALGRLLRTTSNRDAT